MFRGPGSAKQRAEALRNEQIVIEINVPSAIDPSGVVSIHIIDAYKHMGAWVNSQDQLVTEVKYRGQSMMQTLRPLKTRVFSAPQIHLATRYGLSESLLFSRLFFNSAVWGQLSIAAARSLDHNYITAIRTVQRKCRVAHSCGSKDSEVIFYSRRPPCPRAYSDQ